jgi:hypothetical protein
MLVIQGMLTSMQKMSPLPFPPATTVLLTLLLVVNSQAHLLVEIARQQLLLADKNVLREQQVPA